MTRILRQEPDRTRAEQTLGRRENTSLHFSTSPTTNYRGNLLESLVYGNLEMPVNKRIIMEKSRSRRVTVALTAHAPQKDEGIVFT